MDMCVNGHIFISFKYCKEILPTKKIVYYSSQERGLQGKEKGCHTAHTQGHLGKYQEAKRR